MPATFTVDSTGNGGDANLGDGLAKDANNQTTLRAAMEEGNELARLSLGADHIINFSSTVFASPGLYNIPVLNAQLLLKASFTINGPTAATVNVQPIFVNQIGQPPQAFRIMQVDPESTSTIKNLTLSGGREPNAGGGGIWNKGVLTVQDSKIVGCSAAAGGGISNLLNLTVIRSHIEHNAAANGDGGGIFCAAASSCTTTITDSFINDNDAGKGGAISILALATVTVSGTEMKDNTCSGPGGAVYNSGGTFTMSGGSLEHNYALEGGGLYNSAGTCTLTSVLVKLNEASAWGGGVHAKTGTTNITGCTFDQNTATAGGPKVSYEGNLGVNTFINIDATCIGVSSTDIVQKT